jgi:hypothetical protein
LLETTPDAFNQLVWSHQKVCSIIWDSMIEYGKLAWLKVRKAKFHFDPGGAMVVWGGWWGFFLPLFFPFLPSLLSRLISAVSCNSISFCNSRSLLLFQQKQKKNKKEFMSLSLFPSSLRNSKPPTFGWKRLMTFHMFN